MHILQKIHEGAVDSFLEVNNFGDAIFTTLLFKK